AAAWFAPFPPRTCTNDPSVTVSPGRGSRGPCHTRSTLADPTTTTRTTARRYRYRGGWARPREYGGCDAARPDPLHQHHRPYRPREVDARRPAPRADGRRRPARHARAVPRHDGPRARARHHDQGPERAARVERLRRQPDRHARPRRLRLRGQP